MGRKEDDIFRKLNKQKPLVKRGDISPLSSGDFKRNRDEELSHQAAEQRHNPPLRETGQLGRNTQRQTTAPRQGLTVFGEEDSAHVRRPSARKPVVRSAMPPSAARTSESLPVNRKREDAPNSMQIEGRQPANREGAPRNRSVYEPTQRGVHDDEQSEVRRPPTREAARNRDTHETYSSRSQPVEKDSIKLRQTDEDFDMSAEQAVFAHERSYGHVMPVQKSAEAHSELAPDAAGAALSFRHELKYYINYHDYVLLKSTLKSLLSLDANAGANGDYHIRSLYFDDVYETALAEKMAGYNERNKFRIRIYDLSDDVIKFEKKMKRGQYIAKTSLLISRDECEALIGGNCDCLLGRKEPLAEEILIQMKHNLLRPRVIVDYFREAYVSPFESVRITFDKDIRASLWLADIFDPKVPTMSVLEPGTMVLEVKFNKYLPPFIKSVLNNVNAAQRSAVSKYVLCRKYE